MPLKLSSLRCGECGTRGMELKDIAGWYKTPWKNFPSVEIVTSYEMPVCPNCQNVIAGGGWGKDIDEVIEESIREITSNLTKQLLGQCELTSRGFSKIIGVTPEDLSNLLHKKITVSYTLYQLLSLLAADRNLLNTLIEKDIQRV